MGLVDRFPGRKKRRAVIEEARREEAITSMREAVADAEIRKAYTIAHKLAQHRDENHFSQRIQQVYRGRHV